MKKVITNEMSNKAEELAENLLDLFGYDSENDTYEDNNGEVFDDEQIDFLNELYDFLYNIARINDEIQ